MALKRFKSIFAERSKWEVFSKDPKSKQSYNHLILGIQTRQALDFNVKAEIINLKWFLPGSSMGTSIV